MPEIQFHVQKINTFFTQIGLWVFKTVFLYIFHGFSHICFLFTLHLPGGSLESIIGQDGCLSEDVVRSFGWDLVQGLKYIHRLGIIFSDLTPAKVCIYIHVYAGLTRRTATL